MNHLPGAGVRLSDPRGRVAGTAGIMDPELVFQGDKVKTRDIHKDHFPVGGQGYISEVQSGQEYRTESCCPNLHKAKNMVRVKDRGQR